MSAFARTINDTLPDEDRHLLVPLIGRLFGTGMVVPGWGGHEVVLHFDFGPACAKFLDAVKSTDVTQLKKAVSIHGPAPYSYAILSLLSTSEEKVAFLSALIDEYDRVTGRTQHRQLTDADYRGLAALTQ